MNVLAVIVGYGIRMHPLLQVPRMHLGVDWEAPLGTPVFATGRGQVLTAGAHGEYGNRVLIDHGGGWQSVYGHLASFTVRDGDCIQAGTIIGTVGDTGLTFGPAVHFEVRCKDRDRRSYERADSVNRDATAAATLRGTLLGALDSFATEELASEKLLPSLGVGASRFCPVGSSPGILPVALAVQQSFLKKRCRWFGGRRRS